MPPIDPKFISPKGVKVFADATVSFPPRTADTPPNLALKAHAEKCVVRHLATAAELSAQIVADERELAGLRRDIQARIIEGITA